MARRGLAREPLQELRLPEPPPTPSPAPPGSAKPAPRSRQINAAGRRGETQAEAGNPGETKLSGDGGARSWRPRGRRERETEAERGRDGRMQMGVTVWGGDIGRRGQRGQRQGFQRPGETFENESCPEAGRGRNRRFSHRAWGGGCAGGWGEGAGREQAGRVKAFGCGRDGRYPPCAVLRHCGRSPFCDSRGRGKEACGLTHNPSFSRGPSWPTRSRPGLAPPSPLPGLPDSSYLAHPSTCSCSWSGGRWRRGGEARGGGLQQQAVP